MNILGLLLDVPAPRLPDTTEVPKDTTTAPAAVTEDVAKAGSSHLTLYLVIAGVAVLAIAAWYFWRRKNKA